jgi:hypothetical protein
MLGWSAVAGIVDWSIVTPMYFGGIAWGIMYDLIYAHQVGLVIIHLVPLLFFFLRPLPLLLLFLLLYLLPSPYFPP